MTATCRISGLGGKRSALWALPSHARKVEAEDLLGGAAMQAKVGDRLCVHGRVVGIPDQTSVILEVRGPDGSPPYLVRHDDGHEALVFPGADAMVQHPKAVKKR
jgi:hypothetical protein